MLREKNEILECQTFIFEDVPFHAVTRLTIKLDIIGMLLFFTSFLSEKQKFRNWRVPRTQARRQYIFLRVDDLAV